METVTLEQSEEVKPVIEKFCEDCRLRGMTPESIRRYKSSLKQFAQYFFYLPVT